MMIDLSPLLISLRIALTATTITFFLGIAAANFMCHYRGRWRSLLDGLFLAPMVLPPTVLGFLLLLLLGKNGPLGFLMKNFGFSVVFTWYAAIITATIVAFPLMYKTVLGAFEQIDKNLLQAARTLGASELRLFFRITLPLALPGLLAGSTLAFTRALGEFGATLMLAGNIPGKTQTVPMAIYFAVEAGDFREATFWTMVILAIALGGLIGVNQWKVKKRAPKKQRETQRKSRQRKRLDRERDSLDDHDIYNSQLSLGSLPPSFKKWLSSLPPLSPSSQPFRRHPRYLPRSPHITPHLCVHITKHLPGFTLNVSFNTDNQALGLLGESGAGKSLVLRCIAGLETPDTGRIVLNGRVLFDSEQQINVPSCDRNVGVLFQNYALFPHLTVAENIAFGLPQSLSYRQKQRIVEEQLRAVHLQDMGDRYPISLSGGQQQRVAMARVLANQPEVLLLDEPFSALDTHLRYRIEQDLRLWLEHFAGITLFVTHNMEEAYRVCHHLLVIEQGHVNIHDGKSAVLEYPKTVSTARLTGCKNVSRAFSVNSTTIHALDWNCDLQVLEPLDSSLTHIGIRAHQLQFLEAIGYREHMVQSRNQQLCPLINHSLKVGETEGPSGEEFELLEGQENEAQTQTQQPLPMTPNAFPCWLTMTSETPHRMTLYLKLKAPPTHLQDYHLQAEIFKDKWVVLKEMPFPWSIVLEPKRLMMLRES